MEENCHDRCVRCSLWSEEFECGDEELPLLFGVWQGVVGVVVFVVFRVSEQAELLWHVLCQSVLLLVWTVSPILEGLLRCDS